MGKKSLKKIKVTEGVYWVEAPKAGVYVLCGCPADSVKHLKKLGLIKSVKKKGVPCQTGPNAILLSDALTQNGQFSNLSEFPVLQMLYEQGILLPNHPNNTGIKPLLLGNKKQINAQKQYIYRGNYGLTSLEELKETGLSDEEAHEQMQLKLKFAFGQIKPTQELMDSLTVEEDPVEIRNGVYIHKTGFNCYEFQYGKDTVSVDLNLGSDEFYQPSYKLGYQQLKRDYFSVIHSGEGNGWDMDRPCMGSILIYQGKVYLIDAGPHISYTLDALGIGLNEIEGIFHTHGHDDHFAGLPTLLTSNHRIKYYATPLVRASVTKKLCALMSISDDKFSFYFDTYDLNYDTWNDIDGLEVKPFFSPHPVETSILYFRTSWENQQYTYAHLADIAAFDILEGMITENVDEPGLSSSLYEKVKRDYFTPANLKKIDIGAGLIHGKSEDFVDDPSDKLILSHINRPLTKKEKSFGSAVKFGTVDVLISTSHDYLKLRAQHYLDLHFPKMDAEKKQELINCPIVAFDEGDTLLKMGERNPYVYLILTGTARYLHSNPALNGFMSTGNLAGNIAALKDLPAQGSYRAKSCLQALQIPRELYRTIIQENKHYANLHEKQEDKNFLRMTKPFNTVDIDDMILERIVHETTLHTYKKGPCIPIKRDVRLLKLEK